MYKVLIADDEDIICRGLAGMVSEHPKLQVVALAEDGEIALEKAMETQPDLMLVDINMPFLNGLEFIEKIQESLPDVVIIVVTGYDDFEFVRKALQLGVADYLLKPIMEEPFFEVLDKAVERLDRIDKSKKFYRWIEEQMQGESIVDFPMHFEQVMASNKEKKHYSDIVLQVISIIDEQWANSDLSLQSVADSLYVSAPYLSRIFHKETGENFGVYLTRKRIQEAQNLLKNTNMKMYEIAEKTGYASQHYFSNAFKKVLGISPVDYRKNKGL